MRKITLRTARINSGLKLEEVARKMKMSVETLSEYEADPGQLTIEEAYSFQCLYKVPLDIIDFSPFQNNIERHTAAKQEELWDYVRDLIRIGRWVNLFPLVMQIIRGNEDLKEFTALERRDYLAVCAERFCKELSESIQHCGEPVKAAPHFNYASEQYSVVMKCRKCGALHSITESEPIAV